MKNVRYSSNDLIWLTFFIYMIIIAYEDIYEGFLLSIFMLIITMIALGLRNEQYLKIKKGE